jgi:hypothetical protein
MSLNPPGTWREINQEETQASKVRSQRLTDYDLAWP